MSGRPYGRGKGSEHDRQATLSRTWNLFSFASIARYKSRAAPVFIENLTGHAGRGVTRSIKGRRLFAVPVSDNERSDPPVKYELLYTISALFFQNLSEYSFLGTFWSPGHTPQHLHE